MNALQRDFKRLIPRFEMLDAPRVNTDPHRQRIHIQPPVGWLNDPNGLCYADGYYHAFYQYSPFSADGSGAKHWGHYRSCDLLHWEQLPVMISPDTPFDCHGAYSGSALYEDGIWYFFYTGNVKYPGDYDYIKTGRGHNTCLGISRDGVTLDRKYCLMTNADYPAGLTCHVRDPKVWRQDDQYYMVLGARTEKDRGEVLVYTSADRLNWRHCNTLTTPEPYGYMWECPDLFKVNGQWYLALSPQGAPSENVYGCGYFPIYGDWRSEYQLGAFRAFDHGFDYYAPQSFSADDRRLQFGWLGMPDAEYSNPTVSYGWQHCLTVPCELTADGDMLRRTPAKELETLRGVAVSVPNAETVHTSLPAELVASPTGSFCLTIADGLTLEYAETDRLCRLHFLSDKLGYGRTVRHAVLEAPCRSLRMIADASSLEIFLNNGACVFSTRFYPASELVTIRLEGTDGILYPLSLT